MTWARTAYDSRLGRYAVAWVLDQGVLEVQVDVPVGGEAAVRLRGELVEPVAGLGTEQGRTGGTVGSGRWTVRVRQE